MNARFTAVGLCAAALQLGCSSSYGDGIATAEPLIVTSAVFNKGDLPNDGGPELPMAVANNGLALAGGPEKGMSGSATRTAYGVAIKMKGAGTGYWTLSVGVPDLVDTERLTWAAKFRFTDQAPLGDQVVQIAETDVNGKFGVPAEIKFKIKSLLPEGKKVISLIWHNKADLDLQVQGPAGKITSAKTPNTGVVPDDHKIPDGGIEGSGTLSRDSNARCAFDGIMQEDVVFSGDPTPGDYLVWVSEFDHCGEASTTFELVLHEDGVETFRTNGRMLDINADNGTGAGLFMNTFSF